MPGTICATHRMRRRPFHFHYCSCSPIHNASCAPFAPCLRGLGPPEGGLAVLHPWVGSSTKFEAPSHNRFRNFDEASEPISCIESNSLELSLFAGSIFAPAIICMNLHNLTAHRQHPICGWFGSHVMRNSKRKLRLVESQQTMLNHSKQFRCGDKILESGIYRVYHRNHRLAHEVTLLRDQLFPKMHKVRGRGFI